jgi:hypothetical protein
MGRSRNYRSKIPIRIPIPPPGGEMKSKKDYKRDRYEEIKLIEEELKEMEEMDE